MRTDPVQSSQYTKKKRVQDSISKNIFFCKSQFLFYGQGAKSCDAKWIEAIALGKIFDALKQGKIIIMKSLTDDHSSQTHKLQSRQFFYKAISQVTQIFTNIALRTTAV